MEIEKLFSAEEIEILDHILLEEYPKIQMNSIQLFERWSWFINQKIINTGLYTVDEYINDLGMRKIISKITKNSPIPINEKLAKWLEFQDVLYIEQTVGVINPIYPIDNHPELKWLFTRIPKYPGKIMKKSLIERGIVDE